MIIVLSLSLLESLFILPAHLAHAKAGGSKERGLGAKLHHGQQGFSRSFNRAVEIVYRPILLFCLRFRYVTACIALGLFLVVGGYATSAHMGMVLMPEVSADEIEAGVRMPVGTTQDQSAEIAKVVTDASIRMFEEHNLYEVAEGIKTNVRGQDFIDVEIVMKPPDQRDMTANEVIELWRVIPLRMVPSSSGVTATPSMTKNTFMVPHSSMYFCSTPSSQRTLSYPCC